MDILEGLEPKPVFRHFEKICAIPHGSGNEQALGDYICQFAMENGLCHIRDAWGNILLVAEASPGYEEEDTLILQGHMDMVTVQDADAHYDLKHDPIPVQYDAKDNMIFAKGTSLGADDGIAIACALAVLEDKTIPHPRLEVAFTVSEETGMEGAMHCNVSDLKGHRMINLDNEEEGIFIISCAGGMRADFCLPVTRKSVSGKRYTVRIFGATGGHSGTEIIHGSANANCLMGRLIKQLSQETDIAVENLCGGEADNAIPCEASAELVIPEKDGSHFVSLFPTIEHAFRSEYAITDPNLRVVTDENGAGDFSCLTKESLEKVCEAFCTLPNGVQAMSDVMPGMVETSLNLGLMNLSQENLTLSYAIRSARQAAKQAVADKIKEIAALLGADVCVRGDYPGWPYRSHSPLRAKMCRVYEQLFGKQPQLAAIHAGLECGVFISRIPHLDCISCGPDMWNVHTSRERLSVSSVQSFWKFLLAVLADKENEE